MFAYSLSLSFSAPRTVTTREQRLTCPEIRVPNFLSLMAVVFLECGVDAAARERKVKESRGTCARASASPEVLESGRFVWVFRVAQMRGLLACFVKQSGLKINNVFRIFVAVVHDAE